jgi:signal transduction histidine kinase
VQSALKLRRLRVELRDHYELLKCQRDDLLRLQLQKERLTAFVVHDLKNPVNSMDLHAQLLLRERELPTSARESAVRIRMEARQLNRMILNLLDLAKADEGQLSPKRSDVNLRALVDEVLAELAVNA